MNLLSHSSFLKALGWCLLNSIWQFGAIWLLFMVIIRLKKNFSPAAKHGLALLFLSTGFLWFLASLSTRYFYYSDPGNTITPIYNLSGNYSFVYGYVQSFLEVGMPYLSLFYLLMVAGFFIRFFGYFYYAQALHVRGRKKIRAEWRLYVQQLVQQLDIRRNVQIWISEYIDTPMVMGFLKPVILVPIACINQLSVKQLEAILLHEIAHIKRNDYLVNLYISTLEILFFFNPFTKLFIKCIKQEREKSCDDWVLQFRFEPYEYASALFTLEQNRSATAYSLAIAATGEGKNMLLHRIQRIMGIKTSKPRSGFHLLAYFFTIGLLSFIALVNPGEIVVKKLDPTIASIYRQVPEFSTNFYRAISNELAMPVADKTIKAKKPATKKFSKPPVTTGEKTGQENAFDSDLAMAVNDDETAQVTFINSVTPENKDFSIKEIEPPVVPVIAADKEFPFVPNSSFSYFSTEDSSLAKIKLDKYHNQAIRQYLVQAQRELQHMDMSKIKRLEKTSKTNLPELQKKIQESVQHFNLQQLYRQLQNLDHNESLEYLKSESKEEKETINYYKVLKLQYESIKTELQKQQDNNTNEADKRLREIQKQIKKIKVIVNI